MTEQTGPGPITHPLGPGFSVAVGARWVVARPVPRPSDQRPSNTTLQWTLVGPHGTPVLQNDYIDALQLTIGDVLQRPT